MDVWEEQAGKTDFPSLSGCENLFWTWLPAYSFIPGRQTCRPLCLPRNKGTNCSRLLGLEWVPAASWTPVTLWALRAACPCRPWDWRVGLLAEGNFLTRVGGFVHEAVFLLLQRLPVRGKEFYGSSPFPSSQPRGSWRTRAGWTRAQVSGGSWRGD